MTRTESPSSGPEAKRALNYLTDAKLKAPLSKLNVTAMQTLLGAVQRAGSLEEIEIILRYQQARENQQTRAQGGWVSVLVDQILADLRVSAEKATEDKDKVRAAAQQLGLIARIHRVVEDRGDRSERGGVR